MTTQNPFNRQQLETIRPEERGILDELDLPPQLISFLKKNKKNIQITIILFTIIFIAWVSYDYYREVRKDTSNNLLAAATSKSTPEKKILEEVLTKYSGTDAALWAEVELAHQQAKNSEIDSAMSRYQEQLGKISPDNPLTPLLEHRLARFYEQQGKFKEAVEHYQRLSKTKGFEGTGFLGIGRIYEAENKPIKAKTAYEEYLLKQENPPAKIKAWLDHKINILAN
jgi:predicted negative regulator of RcsB-dependent stress response